MEKEETKRRTRLMEKEINTSSLNVRFENEKWMFSNDWLIKNILKIFFNVKVVIPRRYQEHMEKYITREILRASLIDHIFYSRDIRKKVVSNHFKFFTLWRLPCKLSLFSLLRVFFLLLRGLNLRGKLGLSLHREVWILAAWRGVEYPLLEKV